ncbi:MAG: hypothetical protein L0241_04885, partial [Planctomycetia bacterium]|nr:hypothetical protein [Planctomycetia bacterium]
LSGLRELKISQIEHHAVRIAELVASSESLAGLESVTFWQDQFPLGAALVIAGSKTLRPRRLTGLGSNCGDAGAQALAQSPVVSQLESLSLSSNQLTAAGAIALAESSALGPLWKLDLCGNPIGTEGVTAIARSPRLAGLRVLSLWAIDPGPDALAELARSEQLRNLRSLSWRHNNLSANAAKAFADAPRSLNCVCWTFPTTSLTRAESLNSPPRGISLDSNV